MKSRKSIWTMILGLSVVGAVLGFGVLEAHERSAWPTPPDGWWKGLKKKSEARYSMSMGPIECSLVIRVDKVDGAKVTYTSEAKNGGSLLQPPETKTVDCKNDPKAAGAAMPPGANVRKVGNENIKVGSQSFACEVYELLVDGKALKVWHSRQIPPIFNQGNVRVETQGAVIQMKEYKGPKIGGK